MPTFAALVGLLLSVIGPIFYLMGEAGHRHATALIPVPFGLIIMGAGLASMHPARRKMGMHLAAGVALLALLGSLGGLAGAISRLNSPTPPTSSQSSPALAIAEQSIMSVVCLFFLIACINWFMANRRQRKAAGAAS